MRWTVLAMVLCFVLFLPESGWAAEPCSRPDAEQAELTAATEHFWAYHIFRSKGPEPDMEVLLNRGEFAALMVNTLGMRDQAASITESRFRDLNGHWAVGAVKVLAAEGIIRGYSDGEYHPDEPILLEHVKIMIARLLHLGEVPAGQLDDRLQAGGVNPHLACSSNGVTLAQAVLLLDRAMSIPLYTRYKNETP